MLGEFFDFINTAHFALEKWKLDHVEIFIEVQNLLQIFVLDSLSCLAHSAAALGVRRQHQQLVDNHIVHVDVLDVQFLQRENRAADKTFKKNN